jgi:hypothetical protein
MGRGSCGAASAHSSSSDDGRQSGQEAEGLTGASGNDGITEGTQSVHPTGYPIIHSTNRGERRAFAFPRRERKASVIVVPAWLASAVVVCLAVERESATVGVGHSVPHKLSRVCSDGVPALGRLELLPFCELPY